MKKTIIALSLAMAFLCSCRKAEVNVFHTFNNPVLAGFYPDPSVCNAEGDYYMVNSTFSYFPGIPVFHSKDLVNWKQIGHVITRPEQADFGGLPVSAGMFAPAISYRDSAFYVVCTLVGGGGNFVATAENPAGPWSDPVWLPEVKGIDPSLFFDDDAKAYIVFNSEAPDNKPLYNGHCTIRMYGFDVENLKVTGEEKILVNGGVDIEKKPIWIEGPHLYKKDGFYYLMAAEGGTENNHSEVIFRSKSLDGPFEPYEDNPILTQRHLNPSRPNPVTSTGHADLIEAADGSWWAVFLGCRPYPPVEKDFYNTGRETFMAPVAWIDGWPVINNDYDEIQYSYPAPAAVEGSGRIPYNGNFRIWDDFDRDSLQLYWVFLRTPKENWYDLKETKSRLAMRVRPETCSGTGNPSFIGRRQQHMHGYANTSMVFHPKSDHEKSGLVVFQNDSRFYYLCKSLEENAPAVQLYQSSPEAENGMRLLASVKLLTDDPSAALTLKAEFKGNIYSFYFSEKPGEWKPVGADVDASFLSTRSAEGFVGCMLAMYATSSGQPSDNTAWFNWFEYNGDDRIYRRENAFARK